MSKSDIVEKYALLRPHYVAFTERIQALISELVRIHDIRAHLIEGRAKTIESFREKIRRPGKSYRNPLEELTDLSGIRVIVYYLDDVEKIANILSHEFVIVESENAHLASEYSPNQFGYISLHYVVSLKPDRARLPEWSGYKGYRSEIQIRTVLQHGWAAVSHALQYKHESDVPKPLRRKLYRLAGLFELADEEFLSIRNETELLRTKAGQALDQGSVAVPLNPISLGEFIQRWGKLNNIRKMMQSIGYRFDPMPDFYDEGDSTDHLGQISLHCEKLGIRTIQAFESVIDYDATSFFKRIYNETKNEWYVSDEFVLYLLLIRAKLEYFVVEDLVKLGWGKDIAARVLKGAKEDQDETLSDAKDR